MEKDFSTSDITRIKDAMMRLERCDKSLNTKIDKLTSLNEGFEEKAKELALEVDLFKDARNGIENILRSTAKESFDATLTNIIPKLVSEFSSRTQQITEGTIQNAKRMSAEIEESTRKATTLMNKQAKILTRQTLGLITAFFLSSILTAFGISYYFPRYVNYQITPRIAETMMLGEAVHEMYGELTPKQKTQLLNLFEKRYKESLMNRR